MTENEPKRSRGKWVRIAIAVAVLMIVGSMVRGIVTGGGGESAVNVTGGKGGSQNAREGPPPSKAPARESAPAGQRQAKTPSTAPSTADVDGDVIPAGGGPIILLNPGLVRPGAQVTVSGTGFDPRARVDISFRESGSPQRTTVASVRTDKSGSISAGFAAPEELARSSATVVAQQRNSDNVARAQARVPGGVGTVELSEEVGEPGSQITVSASGFAPGETVDVYWDSLNGRPDEQLQADEAGDIDEASIRVGVGAVGDSTLLLVGNESKTAATAGFAMLGLYPTVEVSPYAVKGGTRLGFSGEGFAPDERVLVYVNESGGRPLLKARADTNGGFSSTGFKVPFKLKGQQQLTLIGEDSRAAVSSGFQILPYTPTAQANTYGGLPGTELSFYGSGFAPREVVLVYEGRSKSDPGELVTAFRANSQGKATAAGSYTIPGDAQGKLNFTLVGRMSDGTAGTTVSVTPSDVPVEVPPQPEYTLPPELKPGAGKSQPGNARDGQGREDRRNEASRTKDRHGKNGRVARDTS